MVASATSKEKFLIRTCFKVGVTGASPAERRWAKRLHMKCPSFTWEQFRRHLAYLRAKKGSEAVANARAAFEMPETQQFLRDTLGDDGDSDDSIFYDATSRESSFSYNRHKDDQPIGSTSTSIHTRANTNDRAGQIQAGYNATQIQLSKPTNDNMGGGQELPVCTLCSRCKATIPALPCENPIKTVTSREDINVSASLGMGGGIDVSDDVGRDVSGDTNKGPPVLLAFCGYVYKTGDGMVIVDRLRPVIRGELTTRERVVCKVDSEGLELEIGDSIEICGYQEVSGIVIATDIYTLERVTGYSNKAIRGASYLSTLVDKEIFDNDVDELA